MTFFAPARVIVTRTSLGPRKGFHDSAEIFGTNGRHAVIRCSSVPWEASDRADGRRARHLAPGAYLALPSSADREGAMVPDGEPVYLLTDGRGGAQLPALEGGRLGPVGVYAEPMVGPHIGCITVRAGDWQRFRSFVGGERRFVLELRHAPRIATGAAS